jgi:hypothetical protein
MISREDCIALCGLKEEEVRAIAEHEHVPDIAAAAMVRYLLKKPEGLIASTMTFAPLPRAATTIMPRS